MVVKALLQVVTILVATSVATSSEFYQIRWKDIDGEDLDFSTFKNKVVVVVNVASQCGYTLSAYKALNEAHRLLGDEVVFLAVPSDEFKQELPTASEVSKFTKEDMGVEFIVSDKALLNGESSHSLYRFLKGEDVESCRNMHASCDSWADVGECEKNPNYMLEHCKPACKVCTPKYKFSGEVKWNFEYFVVNKRGDVVNRYPTGTLMNDQSILSYLRKLAAEDVEEECSQ
eukprot:CAMPEP_0184019082 /NCGR_PEP_ID=MMETSP0954-20121128/8542_1 /TAXON_ID=627963 /ORGANISM="Aplanochytrium sp, Strain PBS07" /LENGTH=229 /DNA_ID=CAMNT_0026300685 /DNA_START=1294 /DNA_END=1983 /DNA_ORIENTATION=-